MSPEEYFATLWPELVPKLRTMLARAGAPATDRDDLVQETALRLYRMWPKVDQERGVEPLARRIAMNAWRDQWRRRGEREVLGDIPELATGNDTERTALARIEVREVSRALGRLRPATAAVLRTAAADAERDPAVGEGGTPAALRMARCRARRALQASLRVACAAAVLAVAALRALGRPARTAVAAGAVATVALVLTLSTIAAPAPRPGRIEVWPATAVRESAIHVATPPRATVASSRTGRPAAARRVAKRPSAKPTPYYVIHAGPGEVRAFLNVEVEGYGLRVEGSPANGPTPVCGYGATPDSPLNPRCANP
jgi:DNA-directed RNA polymerase specialized sigma24 family protein